MSDSELLSAYITKIVSDSSGVAPADVKTSTSFYELGIDSLQALSLRASLSKRVGCRVFGRDL